MPGRVSRLALGQVTWPSSPTLPAQFHPWSKKIVQTSNNSIAYQGNLISYGMQNLPE
jgi:hypothetical protein